MRAFPIDTSKHAYYGKTCLECGELMRVGDVALVEAKQNDRAVVDRELFWHLRCVKAVVETAPAEQAEVREAVDKILASIAATGKGPVSHTLDGDDDD